MISLEEYKKALGSRIGKMTDEEIKNRMEIQAKIAKAIFNMWSNNLKEKSNSITKSKLV